MPGLTFGFAVFSLSDINECTEDIDECHAAAECFNTIGSYCCVCEHGYHGNGFRCAGIMPNNPSFYYDKL